ncbi:hypothetical protein FRB99_002740 [Tulasnella sp. 403]|nr:hypothetical protein FRB99_002740 [Tulasnella sp. 403]
MQLNTLIRTRFVATATKRHVKGVLISPSRRARQYISDNSPSPRLTFPSPSTAVTRLLPLAPLSSCLQMRRRTHTTSSRDSGTSTAVSDEHDEHDHPNHQGHSHDGHPHSRGGIFHSHSHDHTHGDQSAEAVVKFLKGEGLDKGTKVTVLGLFTNVGLTIAKGAAGWYFHSAALLAEAGHSLSDLLADFVTLVCWRTSRQPPSDNYPYGFGKFESFGTVTVSLLLIGAALAIGHHSYSTVLHVLEPSIAALPAGAAHDILQTFVSANLTALDAVRDMLPHSHSHAHTHVQGGESQTMQLVSIHAAWFALASVITKEWIYRRTKKVADEERSPVLDANALHHRSDAYSSGVALMAIVGSWAIPGLPLDALGGTLISILIFQQGFGLFVGAMRDLTDAGVNASTRKALKQIVYPLVTPPTSASTSSYPNTESILGIRNVRAVRSGSLMFVDLTADVSPLMTMREAHHVEARIRDAIMENRKEVREVRVHLHALEDGQTTRQKNDNKPCSPC